MIQERSLPRLCRAQSRTCRKRASWQDGVRTPAATSPPHLVLRAFMISRSRREHVRDDPPGSCACSCTGRTLSTGRAPGSTMCVCWTPRPAPALPLARADTCTLASACTATDSTARPAWLPACARASRARRTAQFKARCCTRRDLLHGPHAPAARSARAASRARRTAHCTARLPACQLHLPARPAEPSARELTPLSVACIAHPSFKLHETGRPVSGSELLCPSQTAEMWPGSSDKRKTLKNQRIQLGGIPWECKHLLRIRVIFYDDIKSALCHFQNNLYTQQPTQSRPASR